MNPGIIEVIGHFSLFGSVSTSVAWPDEQRMSALHREGVTVSFGVLGPVLAWDADGGRIDLKGPRHRAVLARLLVARGRMVPVEVIVDDLWEHPVEGTKSAVRTFVAALRPRGYWSPKAPDTPSVPSRIASTRGVSSGRCVTRTTSLPLPPWPG
ncbi:AfsR/SARP family transcriptional regulator [Nocardia cyriacigeorgica]|uniref:AfsR/SARP family transcriptional regulator n=1 Tax=Nocardia cyriacigeorgica TaxID=135487 RepID=UPI002B4B8DB7|nr:helix-turn-helix domain-containing protein [Nocardia cyriacigeorgica]